MATKTPSAAQLAARKLFAQRARAGTLAKPARKTTPRKPAARRSNPAKPPRAFAGSSSQLIGIKFNAGNDRNGNPRRGWLVVEIIDGADMRPVGFVVDDYSGIRALVEEFGIDVPSIGVFDLAPKQYAEWKKLGPRWVR